MEAIKQAIVEYEAIKNNPEFPDTIHLFSKEKIRLYAKLAREQIEDDKLRNSRNLLNLLFGELYEALEEKNGKKPILGDICRMIAILLRWHDLEGEANDMQRKGSIHSIL